MIIACTTRVHTTTQFNIKIFLWPVIKSQEKSHNVGLGKKSEMIYYGGLELSFIKKYLFNSFET